MMLIIQEKKKRKDRKKRVVKREGGVASVACFMVVFYWGVGEKKGRLERNVNEESDKPTGNVHYAVIRLMIGRSKSVKINFTASCNLILIHDIALQTNQVRHSQQYLCTTSSPNMGDFSHVHTCQVYKRFYNFYKY